MSIDDKVFSTWVAACETSSTFTGRSIILISAGNFIVLSFYNFGSTIKALAAKHGAEISTKYAVCVSLPPISRKRKVDLLPVDNGASTYFLSNIY